LAVDVVADRFGRHHQLFGAVHAAQLPGMKPRAASPFSRLPSMSLDPAAL
jgi:hypothetical protein